MATSELINSIHKLHNQGSLRDIDFYLMEMLERRYPGTAPEALLAAALVSHSGQEQHVCLELEKTAGKDWPDSPGEARFQIRLPDKDRWINLLKKSDICAPPDQDATTPLVLDGARLYLRRYFTYEKTVAEKLLQLSAPRASNIVNACKKNTQDLLNILFPTDPGTSNDKQLAAAKAVLDKQLLIISGGPGTGKTYTLARLIALLVASDDKMPSIKMAAPTGKAAMRMRDSIKKAKNDIMSELQQRGGYEHLLAKIASIPEGACTLHRLLGTIPGSTKFRHNADNRLAADIVVIDEASMIDLAMMAKTLTALPDGTKLILLGDMHQLASVDPGYVMGDICKAAQNNPHSDLGKSLVELTHSHRFGKHSAIGKLSSAIHKAGSTEDPDGKSASKLLGELHSQEVGTGEVDDRVILYPTPESLTSGNLPIRDFSEIIRNNYKNLIRAETIKEAFDALSEFRVLCPLRKGPHGVESINRLIVEALSNNRTDNNDTPRLNPAGDFYKYRVIMITNNDYGLNLFNGDIGIVMPQNANSAPQPKATPETENAEKYVVWFESTNEKTGESEFRYLNCNMLPEHETAFAMTVHKSQGSEYKNIMFIMPPRDNKKLFTKEMLYTAITRARKKVYLWCNNDIFRKVACRQTECSSGLQEKLTGNFMKCCQICSTAAASNP